MSVVGLCRDGQTGRVSGRQTGPRKMTYMTGIYLVSAGRLGEPHRGTGGFPVPSKEGKSRPADLHPLTLLPPATTDRRGVVGGSSGVLNNQDRRLVRVVVSRPDDAQHPVREVDRVARLPVGNRRLQRRRVSDLLPRAGCAL